MKTFNAQSPAKVGETLSYAGEQSPVIVTACKKITHWHRDFSGRKHSPVKLWQISYRIA